MRGTPRATPTGARRKRIAPGDLVRRLVEEACNGGNLAVLDEALALPAPVADGSASGAPDAGDAPGDAGAERLRPLLAAFRAAVPDARWTITEQITAGNTVVTRLAVRGIFSGPLLGLAPPGRPATLTGVAIWRFARGNLVDVWLQADLLGLLQQLGVMPPLDLDRAVALAQVQRAGSLLAAEPAPHASTLPPTGKRG